MQSLDDWKRNLVKMNLTKIVGGNFQYALLSKFQKYDKEVRIDSQQEYLRDVIEMTIYTILSFPEIVARGNMLNTLSAADYFGLMTEVAVSINLQNVFNLMCALYMHFRVGTSKMYTISKNYRVLPEQRWNEPGQTRFVYSWQDKKILEQAVSNIRYIIKSIRFLPHGLDEFLEKNAEIPPQSFAKVSNADVFIESNSILKLRTAIPNLSEIVRCIAVTIYVEMLSNTEISRSMTGNELKLTPNNPSFANFFALAFMFAHGEHNEAIDYKILNGANVQEDLANTEFVEQTDLTKTTRKVYQPEPDEIEDIINSNEDVTRGIPDYLIEDDTQNELTNKD